MSTTTEVREGDVIRYEPANQWCHDGYAIAERRRDGRVVLVDTYWMGGGEGSVVNPDEFEVLFNLSDYEQKTVRVWETYAPADREDIPRHSGYQTLHLVRKDATPDLATQIENAREKLAEAERKVESAQWSVECARRELALLEDRATPSPAVVRGDRHQEREAR